MSLVREFPHLNTKATAFPAAGSRSPGSDRQTAPENTTTKLSGHGYENVKKKADFFFRCDAMRSSESKTTTV